MSLFPFFFYNLFSRFESRSQISSQRLSTLTPFLAVQGKRVKTQQGEEVETVVEIGNRSNETKGTADVAAEVEWGSWELTRGCQHCKGPLFVLLCMFLNGMRVHVNANCNLKYQAALFYDIYVYECLVEE
ncbi:hypothetical protein COLO4_32708 [Corchorus olitorius]|uniref:Uncharacterized protein n=1 Tax=Corchorus olitorius TaxID=93759 RepID=A0A1R3GYK3_9ROSI|nr:hypothetical protein COLO4_32708 [Corchorus olitorius]